MERSATKKAYKNINYLFSKKTYTLLLTKPEFFLLYLQEFMSVEHFISELTEYIEWYNNKRIKLKLDGLSPVDYRHKAA